MGNTWYQFIFNFDAKLYWNEEIANNIDNTEFFNNFQNWLEEKNDNKEFPNVESIGATTNGYIFAANADEAIYRITCKMNYRKERRNKK